MQKITRTYIDHLLDAVKIVDYMESEYNSDFIFNNKSKWANTNCPMPNHEDNSPSFGVSIEDNKYNCFGCGATGDVIKLVQQVEGLNFIESIQKLSTFAGIDIELVNLDIKYLIKELKSSHNDYYRTDHKNFFPGGLTEIGFLLAFSERTKKYEKSCNYDADCLKWVEEIYKKLEKNIFNQEYKEINHLWNNFTKMTKESKNAST
jgi:hypothetical protein